MFKNMQVGNGDKNRAAAFTTWIIKDSMKKSFGVQVSIFTANSRTMTFVNVEQIITQ